MAPRKRARNSTGGSVTGGTGDVKPQFMTVNLPVPTAGSLYTVATGQVPRIILGDDEDATIMEMLKVHWYTGIRDEGDVDSLNSGFLNTRALHVQNDSASLTSLTADAADPGTFGMFLHDKSIVTSGGRSLTLPFTVDLTDNNGNGILIATDRFIVTVGAVSDSTPSGATVKILYRMVNVGIREYIGILASQQLG